MSPIKGQGSAVESSTESIEFNFDSLSPNNANQDISLSCNSDQSSPCLIQQNHVGIVPSLAESGFNGVPGSTGNLISEDDTNQGPNLSAGGPDDDSDVAELRLSVDFSSNINHFVEVPNTLGKQEDISSGSKVGISDLADKTREVKGGSRQIFEVGSSSGSRQAGNNLPNNLSVHLNDSSSDTSSMSPWNLPQVNFQEYPALRTSAGLHSSSNAYAHPSASIRPDMPHGNFNPGLDMSSRQNHTLFDALLASGSPLLPMVLIPSHSFSPMWLNDFSAGPRPSSSPDMSRPGFVPTVSGNLPQSPLTINSNSRAGSSTERRLLPDPRDLVHHPHHYSLAVGSYGALNGASNHQMEHNSDFRQWPSLPWAPPSTNQAGRQQTALNYPPGFLSPWNGPRSGAWNLDFAPYPYPSTYGHAALADQVLPQHGHNVPGQNPYVSGPLISQPGHHLRRLGVPQTSQSMEAEVERDHWPMSEDLLMYLPPQPIPRDIQMYVQAQPLPQHVQMYLQAQATLLPPTFWFPETMFLQDMHRHMRLDVDSMSYEELLALGEQIGNVRTGLREETIMELLKRRNYECAFGNPISDAEICCICREDYVRGEDIGELNCGHEFHTGCIKQWLGIKNTCPICQVKGLGE